MLRKALVYLRREYNTNLRQILMIAGGVFALTLILGVLLDVFAPFERWWNVLRSAVLIPQTVSIFTLMYLGALYLHYQRLQIQEDWEPYRLRFSVRLRRQMAAVGGAIIFVFIYATSFGPGYTFMSSFLLALVIGLLAFIRPTQKEFVREEYGLPDSRDIKYNREKRNLEELRNEVDEEKREKRRARFRKVIKNERSS